MDIAEIPMVEDDTPEDHDVFTAIVSNDGNTEHRHSTLERPEQNQVSCSSHLVNGYCVDGEY